MIVELLLALALSQGLTPLRPGATGGGKVLASFPLSVSGPLITEDANTVAHVYWNGTALVDTKGNAWTENGTVPQVTANPFTSVRYGAGPFSAANYYSLGAGSDVLDFTGDFTVCAVGVLPPTLASGQGILLNGVYGATGSGYLLYVNSSATITFDTYAATSTVTRSTAAGSAVGAVFVVCAGRSGGNQSVKVNFGATDTDAGTKTTAGTSVVASIGKNDAPTASAAFGGTIYEIYATSTPFTEATVVALQQKVLGHFDGYSALAVTRATNATYENPAGTVWTAAPGVARITTDGLLVEPARTNYALQSNTMSTGTAATSPWTYTGALATTAGAPVGGNWTAHTSGVVSNNIYQTATTPASTTFAASVWAVKSAGSGPATLGFYGGTPSGCTCVNSDASSCTVGNSGGTWFAYSTVGTTPVRLTVTCTTTSTTGPGIFVSGGQYGTATGTTLFSGAQLEIGTYPTSLIVTTTTATARNADAISATVPAVPSKWCVATTANAAGYDYLWHLGPSGAVNDTVRLQNGVTFAVRDAGGSDKVVTFSAPSLNAAHRYVGCGNAGTLSLTLDGTSTGSVSGAGTGVLTVPPTVFWFGQRSNGASQSAVFLKNIKICAAKSAKECK